MDNFVPLALGMAVVVIVAFVVAELYGKQNRAKQMRSAAARMGFQYLEVEPGLAERLRGFPLFSQAGRRDLTATHLLRAKRDGALLTVFDSSYRTGKRQDRRTVEQSAVLVELEGMSLPAFSLRPKRLAQKLARVLGQKEIRFQGAPGFSRVYQLRGPEEERIRALFDARTLGFLAERPGLWVEGAGDKVLLYRPRKRVPVPELASFVAEAQAVLAVLSGR